MAIPTEIAGKAVGTIQGKSQQGAAPRDREQPGTSGCIFDRLASEHAEVQGMIDRVLSAGEGSDVREEFYDRIRDELLAHSHAEESIFYYSLRSLPELSEKLKGSVDEHHQIEAFLDRLDSLSIDDPSWLDVFRDLAEVVGHHVAEEEGEVFTAARASLGRQSSQILEELYLRAKTRELDSLERGA